MIVGGYAVMRYTEPRYTKDLDILIDPTEENALRVITALKQFGAPLHGLQTVDMTTPGNFFQVGLPPNRVDIIVTIPGVEFKDAYSRREMIQIEDMSIPVLGLGDLIQAKLAAGRPQDLVDAGALAKAQLQGKKYSE